MENQNISLKYGILQSDPIEDSTPYWSLMVNGMYTRCPFAQPLPMPMVGTGKAGLYRYPCSTACPLAEINQESEKIQYKTACNGTVKIFDVEILKLAPKNSIQKR